jgi:hypothetical protein
MASPIQPDATRIDQIRAAAKRRGYSDQEIEQKLQDAGLIQAPKPGLGQQFMHGAGVIGRMGVQGIGNMASLPFGLAGAAYQGVTGNQPPAMLQGNQGTAAANQMGLPQYQGGAERVLGAAGENMVSGALLPGGSIAGRLALGAGAGAAGQGAAEAGAGPFGQMAASLAVGAGLPVAGMILSGGIRAALAGAESRRAASQQALALVQAGNPGGGAGFAASLLNPGGITEQALGKIGVDLPPAGAAVTLGQVAQGGMARTIEGGLRNIPGSSSVIQGTLEKQADQMGQRVERIASAIGPAASKEVVGAAVKRGIQEGFIPNFRATTEQLYSKVYSLVPPASPVTPTAVTRLIAKQNDLLGMARELSDDIVAPKFAGILTNLEQAASSSPNGTIPFTVMKELRSRLGAMQSGEELVSDINLRDVKRLYGAITEDMGAAVQKAGGNQGTAAWNRANLFYQKGMDRIEKILEPLVAKRTPEQAFTALMSGTKEGATALRSTLRSLPAAEQGLVRSNVMRQLGRMPDESFSPELFLRKLHGLAPTARTALFEGDPMTGTQLAALAEMAENRRAAGRVMFNASGTSPNVAFFAILNGLSKIGISGAGALMGQQVGGGMGAAAGAMTAPLLTAAASQQLAERVFTNPRMIQWLVRQTKIPFGAMGQELALLVKDSQKWSTADRQIAQDLSGTLSHMDWRSILLAQSAADATASRQ